MNSHVTSIRHIRGMSLAKLTSDPEYVKITSSRHHLRTVEISNNYKLELVNGKILQIIYRHIRAGVI